MVIREILPFLIALVPAFLWAFILAPLLFRAFGVMIPLNPWKRKGMMKMTEWQSVLWGVLGWGGSMMIFDVLGRYVRWLISGNPSDRQTLWDFGGTVLQWTVGGVLFGLFTTAPKRAQTVE